jgi:hypothetical protein
MKKDIRRLYADMFANVTNSADMQLSEAFHNEFSYPNFEYIQDKSEGDHSPGDTSHFHLKGLSVFLQFWFNHLQLTPDIC